MMGGAKAHYDGIVAFSQTDFTEDLKKITVPVLVMHSEDDQIVPYVTAGPLSAELLKNGILTWGYDASGANKAVKPGDDFNAFANGTYLDNLAIPADRSR
jgi:pimeloyl-ACP methyl ester carboxylesterase